MPGILPVTAKDAEPGTASLSGQDYAAASFLTGEPKLSLHRCRPLSFFYKITECFVGFRPASKHSFQCWQSGIQVIVDDYPFLSC